MKRVGNLYIKVYDMENLKVAHQKAKRNKGWYEEVKMVDNDLEKYLTILQDQLKSKTYHTSEYYVFEKREKTKIREIYKLPYFPDRICHWAIMLQIENILIKTFIADTYSAIPNRGLHQAVAKIKKAVQNDPENTVYCMKLDVKKYYPSIDHTILKEKYAKRTKDKDLLWLIYEIIDSNKKGIPIGNYLSQYSGNLYLSDFDHWLKEDKRIKYYFRYMDDIIILHKDKQFLKQLLIEIEDYMTNKLKLTIKDNKQIFPVNSRGIDFVGFRIFRKYILLRKSIAMNMKLKCNQVKRKRKINYSDYCSINSYKGWLKYCNSYNLYKSKIQPLEHKLRLYHITLLE